MTKKITYLLFLCITMLSLVSCGYAMRRRNCTNLEKVKTGMSKEEVLTIMGKPLENEVYNNKNVWYYFSESKWSDGAITHDECTPLFFEENKLLGWGHKEYNDYKRRDW